jgi:hypothetical protein
MNSPTNSQPDNTPQDEDLHTFIERIGNWKVNFGKHKGVAYKNMATDHIKYLRWMRKNKVCNNENVNAFIDSYI